MDQKLRQEILSLLMKKFGNKAANQSIYECADEWIEKGNVNTHGNVKYFEAYYL